MRLKTNEFYTCCCDVFICRVSASSSILVMPELVVITGTVRSPYCILSVEISRRMLNMRKFLSLVCMIYIQNLIQYNGLSTIQITVRTTDGFFLGIALLSRFSIIHAWKRKSIVSFGAWNPIYILSSLSRETNDDKDKRVFS